MVLLYIWVDLPQNMYFDYAWHWTIKYFTSSYFLKHTHVSLGYCITNLCHKRKKKHLKSVREENLFMKIPKEQFVSFLKSSCVVLISSSYSNGTIIKCVPSTFILRANTQGSYFVYQEIHRTNKFFYLYLMFESLVNSLLISTVSMSQ